MSETTVLRVDMSLPDGWKLGDFNPGEGSVMGAHADGFDDSRWIPVAVPGDVHSALLAANLIPDPFYDRNESQCAWVEGREWWYRLRFDGPAVEPGERWRLVFHGLDTFATVWLNGVMLGQHQNMFREAVFDVTGALRSDQPNLLAVRFDRPLDRLDGFGEFESVWGDNPERVFMRKAQFGYGWDWGPRLPTIGIWRPVALRREVRAVLRGVHFYTLELDAGYRRALVAVRVEADRFDTDQPLTATIRLVHPDPEAPPVIQTIVLDGAGPDLAETAYLDVPDPALWWTHDLGEPILYDLYVTLESGDVLLDEYHTPVGIRTLALDQSPDTDEPGTRFFRFVLNGVPMFARGANWIPAHSFVGAIPPARYEQLLTAARDANMNMLRIWGGGIYEHDIFYALCDRLGILVWQDFMFACAMYPENNPAFVAEVEAEAVYQVRRLRSHPSLALWCGNNENQWIHDMIFWNLPGARVPGALYYDEILPRVVAALDGRTPYWPGSPYGGNDYNSMEDGDRHNWEVWHGNYPRRFGEQPRHGAGPEDVTFLRYADDRGRFISEFGMHAAPVIETLRRSIPEDQLYHHSPAMDHHNKDNPKNKGDNLMLTVTGLPDTLDDYIDFSMIAQAEGLKFGIEHFRRRKPHCSGTLFWQLNDCWPALSWSVLDYYGFGKAGYFYARRAYAPVLASFKDLGEAGVELWIVNDTLDAIEDSVRVVLGSFDGAVVWEESRTISIPPNTSLLVAEWAADEVRAGPDRYLAVRSAGNVFPANRLFFVPIKDLDRSRPEVTMAIRSLDDHTLVAELTADRYAYFVHLSVPHEATIYSDNYFDLTPGEIRAVTVSNRAMPLAAQMVRLDWR